MCSVVHGFAVLCIAVVQCCVVWYSVVPCFVVSIFVLCSVLKRCCVACGGVCFAVLCVCGVVCVWCVCRVCGIVCVVCGVCEGVCM